MSDVHQKVPAYPHAGDDLQSAVISTTECTGLASAPPLSEEEADAYRELYDIPIEQNKNPVDEQ